MTELHPGDIVARFAGMTSARQVTESYWQQVADYMLPSREFTRHSMPGSRRTAPLIYNTYPISCLEQLAGGLHGMLTSPALRWFALRPDDPALQDDRETRAWFELATDIMYGTFTAAESGFDTALHELYLDLAGMGTGAIFTADKGRHGPRYEARPLGEIFVSQSAEGIIDTLYRAYSLPAREVCALWDKTPETIRVLAEKKPDEPIQMLHAVYPADAAKSSWHGAYLIRNPLTLLETGGFHSFPFAVPRWMKRSGETYGFGPGMTVLPDVKLLNKLEEINLRGLAKVVDPALMLPDDGFLNAPSTAPGAFNYYRSGTPQMDKIGPLVTGARPDLGDKAIDQIQKRISRGFYVDWMNLPAQPNMTATEVLQRRDETLRLLGPMVSRVTAELLGPVIKRTFYVLAKNNFLPPLPPLLKGRGYTVEYLSPLATAQRASDAENVIRWFTTVGQMASIDPSVMDIVDTEATARFLAGRLGAPALVVRDQAAIDAKRQAAAQMQQQQHEMAATATAAKAAQDGTGALANMQQLLTQPQQQAGAPAPVAAA